MVEYIVRMEKPYDIGKALHYLNVPFVEIRRVENTSMDNAEIPEGLQHIEDRLKAIEIAVQDNTAFIAKLKIHIENLTNTLKDKKNTLEES